MSVAIVAVLATHTLFGKSVKNNHYCYRQVSKSTSHDTEKITRIGLTVSLTKQYLEDPSTFGVLLPFATTIIGSLGFTKHTVFIKHIGVNYFKINAKIAVRIHFIKKIKNIFDTDQNKNILTDVLKCTYIFILVSVKCIFYFFYFKINQGF